MSNKEITKIILPIPVNLGRMREAEEKIRNDSLVYIAANPDVAFQQEILEIALNLIYNISYHYTTKDENEKVLQIIGFRLFNTSFAAYKLTLSGYYQASLALQRDILEISFLLDYFSFDSCSKIERWRGCKRKERLKEFKPSFICQELDKRDNFKERKRTKYYWLFCEYAAHLTPKSPKLISVPGEIIIGPFFYKDHLKNCLYELAKLVVISTLNYEKLFPNLPEVFIPIRQEFIKKFQEWSNKYLKPLNVKDLERWLDC